jgi:hypothetical protein
MMKHKRDALLILGLVLVLAGATPARAQNFLQNADFDTWSDDSTPANWSVESRTYSGVYKDEGQGQPMPPCVRLERHVAGTGNNKGLLQNVPVTAGLPHTVSAWFMTPAMPDTTQYVSARIVITWRNSSSAAIGSSNPGYIHAPEWTRELYADTAPNNANGDSIAVSADILIRCYGRSGGAAGGMVYADGASFVQGLPIAEENPALPVSGDCTVRPNPFTSAVAVRYAARNHAPAALEVYDATGQVIRTIRSPASARVHEFQWDGRDEIGNEMPGGVYFAVVESGSEQVAVYQLLRLK